MHSPEELSKIIDQYDLTSPDSTRELEFTIRNSWAIREIQLFSDFKLYCEVIAQEKDEHGADRELWSMVCSGMVVHSYAEYQTLKRMFDHLLRTCYVHLGAAAMLGILNARLLHGYLFADEGKGLTLYDMTLSQLIQQVPIEYAKQLDVATKLENIDTKLSTHQNTVVVDGFTKNGMKEAVLIANTKLTEKGFFSDPNLCILFEVSQNTPYNWRMGKAKAPDGFDEAWEKKDEKAMRCIAEKYKANRGKTDVMNKKDRVSGLSDEEMYKMGAKMPNGNIGNPQ